MNAGMAERSNAPDLSWDNCLKGETQDCFREQSGLSAITGSNPVSRNKQKKEAKAEQ